MRMRKIRGLFREESESAENESKETRMKEKRAFIDPCTCFCSRRSYTKI